MSPSVAPGPGVTAAGNTGLCLLDAQKCAWVTLLYLRHHLSKEGFMRTALQLELAGAPGGQHCQTAVY